MRLGLGLGATSSRGRATLALLLAGATIIPVLFLWADPDTWNDTNVWRDAR